MSVRCKMRCDAVEKTGTEPYETFAIKLSPVTSGSKENETYFKYTPGGFIHLAVLNESAAAQFDVGKEYYVDFEPAE